MQKRLDPFHPIVMGLVFYRSESASDNIPNSGIRRSSCRGVKAVATTSLAGIPTERPPPQCRPFSGIDWFQF